LADDEPAASDVDDATTATDEDDHEWPLLSSLELGVCLADGESATPTRPVRPRPKMSSLLSGGRKRRRRPRTLAHHLWLAAAVLAGFIVAAIMVVRI
jgi:hypothetical protein